MTWSEKDKQRAYIGELQGLQRQINFLKKSNEATREPSIENAIETLRNSQDKLYSALAQHGVTAEDVHRVIIETGDNAIVKEIMQLQKAKDTLKKQLTRPNLSSVQEKSLETRLALKTQQHADKWDEAINSPRKDEIISKIQQAQINALHKEERSRDKDRDHDRTR